MTTVAENSGSYEAFLQNRAELVSLIERLLPILSTLNMKGWEDTLAHLKQRVSSNSFKVLVLGEFKRGKSTFINALLGEEILPAYSTPCTAIINEVKWGDSPKALLHSSKSENNSMGQVEEVPVHQIEEFVVIKEETDEINSNRYEKAEIFYPINICRSGVELIDSPGLNEHASREKVTMNYLPIVDAILFVLSCDQLGSETELGVIKNIKTFGHEDIFFICNRINQISRPKERDRIREYGKKLLAPFTQLGEEGIFFLNALGALDGRLQNNEQMLTESGVPDLEKKLEKFLTNDRGRLKIIEPAKELQEAIREAQRVIPEREAMLRIDYKTLEDRYAAAQEPLKQLELQRHQAGTRITHFFDDLQIQIEARLSTFLNGLPEEIEKWIKDYEIKSEFERELNLIEAFKKWTEKIGKEIKEYILSRTETRFITWQTKELSPLLQSRIKDLKLDLDARANDFIHKIEEIRAQLTLEGEPSKLNREQVFSINHILAYSGSFSINNLGWGEVATASSGEVLVALSGTAGATLIAAVLTGPILTILLAIPIMLVGAFAITDLFSEGIKSKIKDVISKEVCKNVRESIKEKPKQVAHEIIGKLGSVQQDVDQGFAKEIQSIRDQVNSILEEKQKGQANVEKKIRELLELSTELKTLEDELDDLITQLELVPL